MTRWCIPLALAALAACATSASAHISVSPDEAVLRESTEFTITVPAEGGLTTNAVRVFFPSQVSVYAVADAPGWTTRVLKKPDGRLRGAEWTGGLIPPNQYATFTVLGTPFEEGTSVWRSEQGLTNVRIITADMNVFDTDQRFDRIVSVEMFEHMSNWRALLERCRNWLHPDGRLLTHVFAHRTAPYRFDVNDPADWIAHHFFAGGVMPSRDLIANFPDLFEVEQDWWWSGKHYERTALDWLKNFDANRDRIRTILADVYGKDARLWENRWRLFFISTAGLFGHAGGNEWGVVHHRLKPV
jgi:SAM-dependent methyltransferase